MSIRFWESKAQKDRREKERMAKDALRQQQYRTEAAERAKKRIQRQKEEKERWNKERQKMYTMEHGTELRINPVTVVDRVPGGWIYHHYKKIRNDDLEPGRVGSEFIFEECGTTFVPFTDQADETFHTLKNKKFNEEES